MTTPKRKVAANSTRVAPNPAETDPLQLLRSDFIYARRRIVFFKEAPQYAQMVDALAPAFAAIDATPPNSPLTQSDAFAIHFALREFQGLCEQAAVRSISDARRQQRRPAADAANEARRRTTDANRTAMNAAAARLETEGCPARSVNRKLAEMYQRTPRQIRNIRADPALSKKRKPR
jgi:hypothetical protein